MPIKINMNKQEKMIIPSHNKMIINKCDKTIKHRELLKKVVSKITKIVIK
jgi:hypothetical protein